MDLRFTDAEIAFRQEVRDFIAKELPVATRERMLAGKSPTKQMVVDWQRKLNARGWAAPEWPKEAGGPGWTLAQRYIFREELQQAPAPSPLGFNINMCGPVIIEFGTEEQKKRFLPRMLNLDDWWCQGFSEPGAGSDLAGLKTRAVREGDHYVVNGQKTWTTLAQHADWIFLLVRTDPNAKKQEGISFLLCDMKTPGITVRPIITIEGGHEVNEVFFDDVKVPVENLVGQENRGWDCAKFLLGNERFGQARVGASRERIRRLKVIAQESLDGGRPLMEDPEFRRKVTEIEVELKALEMTVMRVIATETKRKDKKPDPATSVLKIKGTEIQQLCSELLMKAAGPYAWVDGDPDEEGGGNDVDVAPDWALGLAGVYFNWRKQSIYGGSNEIQRNIMAKAFLGL
ncbi:pimeloyl-CoA dehydrogenase large subunit [Siccirubricoccus deserti]|uniref:Acyl-CoA dehydrogenase family protein n=1 Tax=Siccirubricoccus deserti TaxID=2013562 RepID=A0A9X0R0H9_9PROT|nr:acyl-CoA dehydrogenase family protein [Siccirubricoccus deserti]MBC4016218.1 acyl-CoA dehydrogenase family protein [Siccirubricoccus deserti]GGC48131.1 pimeloyl-CoA dehydrogenase large subunit [Siccirubricoccus deserti]